MEPRAREPVSRRAQPVRPALSRAAIIKAALQIADSENLDAVTMRRVAAALDTSASALYVYIQDRDDLLDAMFDHVMAAVAQAAIPAGTWRERLSWLLIKSVQAASGHGGLAQVALARVPSGPHAREITARVRELLAEGQIPETAIPAALDLLGLFVTAAALDRVPATSSTPQQHHDLLRWETEVILNGLATTAPQTQMPQIQSQGHGHSPARKHRQLLPGHSSGRISSRALDVVRLSAARRPTTGACRPASCPEITVCRAAVVPVGMGRMANSGFTRIGGGADVARRTSLETLRWRVGSA